MDSMKITLAVNRSRNRVLFADAGSDFVDVLLSFLTLPLSALQFCATSSPGCLSNLTDSVGRLRGSKLLKVEACHDMLLTPPATHEHWYATIHDLPSLYVDGRSCRCWEIMARLVHVYNTSISGSGTFVRCKERFVISDDWTIRPASTSTMQSLSHNIFYGFEEVEVCVGWPEVVSILKASLSSDTIFTDVFLPNGTDGHVSVIRRTRQKVLQRSCTESCSGSLPECTVKLFYDRREKKIMYAECKREFVDLLIGFLTYPLSCVIKNTDTQSAGAAACLLGCSFGNLYTSAAALDAAGFMGPGSITRFISIEMLLNPSLGPFSNSCSLQRGAAVELRPEEPYMSLAPYTYCRSFICKSCYHDLVEDRKYVVGDDLLVHQASAMSVAKHWYMRDKANVVEMDVTVQKPEAIALLRAMLTSKTALTDVFIGSLEEPPAVTSETGLVI
ncbi:uncharacterized protein LOC124704750 [Lolium rigidum]|uniref:uncharacterized protein LOC124704750 n=1 Tax=Lolium rigidum TaxID=89674 RepID=UPI001F5CF33D|nr:uncharacterized protein LOC124704750 [Lolium rigidum]